MKRLRRAHRRRSETDKSLRRRIVAAGTAAALSLAGTALGGEPVPIHDAHQIAVAPDADKDFLTDQEELAIGYRPFRPDQNGNTFADGIELAIRCGAAIAQLPAADANDSGRIHKTEKPLRGIEICEICGDNVNMGTVEITNPRLGLHVELPFITLHCLEHGSFSYVSERQAGRVNIPTLLRILELRFPCESDLHQLPLDYSLPDTGKLAPDANDLDGDLLADREELAAGLNLYHADQNENLIPDGPELAQRFAEIVDRLPAFEPNSPDVAEIHRVNYLLRGIEACEICGETVNMGQWRIVNPAQGLSMDVPVIAWHYMQHGSFSYLSHVHGPGRVDLATLRQILEFPRQCGDLGAVEPVEDLAGDCRVDFADLAAQP